jgi:uroporphyrinogen-III decarboxylase
MSHETMTAEERLLAACRLEKPDRVPFVPFHANETNATLTGRTFGQVATNPEESLKAIWEVIEKYGPVDAMFMRPVDVFAVQLGGTFPLKSRIPGVDLPDNYNFQIVEEPIMQLEDYEKICEMGFDKFYTEDYVWRITSVRPEDAPALLKRSEDVMIQLLQECTNRKIPFFTDMGGSHPFGTLSLMRSMVKFTEDLYYHPDLVQRTLRRMMDELIAKTLVMTKQMHSQRIEIPEARASGFFYPLSVFEKFWWPYTIELVDTLWSQGCMTFFHLDTCWDKNLPYFARLPKGSFSLDLDGNTNIFAAKEAVRGIGMIYGDVPPAMMAIGKPADVAVYVKKLIDVVGADGGFVLGNGCSAPPTIKPANLRAFADTARNYEFSRK